MVMSNKESKNKSVVRLKIEGYRVVDCIVRNCEPNT